MAGVIAAAGQERFRKGLCRGRVRRQDDMTSRHRANISASIANAVARAFALQHARHRQRRQMDYAKRRRRTTISLAPACRDIHTDEPSALRCGDCGAMSPTQLAAQAIGLVPSQALSPRLPDVRPTSISPETAAWSAASRSGFPTTPKVNREQPAFERCDTATFVDSGQTSPTAGTRRINVMLRCKHEPGQPRVDTGIHRLQSSCIFRWIAGHPRSVGDGARHTG